MGLRGHGIRCLRSCGVPSRAGVYLHMLSTLASILNRLVFKLLYVSGTNIQDDASLSKQLKLFVCDAWCLNSDEGILAWKFKRVVRGSRGMLFNDCP